MEGGAQLATKSAALVFITTSMVAAGLGARAGQVVAELRRVRRVVLALAANFLAAPLLAWAICAVLPLRPGHAAGLLLLAAAAGAPFLPMLAGRAGGGAAPVIALVVLLVGGTLVFMPLALPWMLPGAPPDPAGVAGRLAILIILPLALGLLARGGWPAGASGLEPIARGLSQGSLALLLALVVVGRLTEFREAVGSGAILAGGLFTVLAGAAGYALGGPDPASRRLLALATATRNVAAALVVAAGWLPDQPDTLVMILLTTLVGLMILLPAAAVLGRRAARTPPIEGAVHA